MALPSNWTRVTVQGKFLNLDGSPLSGRVTFTPSASVLLDTSADAIIAGSTLTVALDETGFFIAQLPATNDADINPTGFTYAVVEPTGRRYNITVPVDAGTIDLVDIVPNVDANPGTVQVITGSGGPPTGGAGGVLSGAYPNPGFAVDMATQAELDAVASLRAPTTDPSFAGTVRAPRIVTPPVTYDYAPTITPDASASSLFRCAATGNLTLADPTGGVDGQQVRVEVRALGADRTLTLTGVTDPVVIPAGERWVGLLAYDATVGDWSLTD